jgi:nucleoside-diphosphate-sugar epimerase
MKIGIIGCNGFVGSALCRAISKTDNELIEINRENYSNFVDTKFDILINSATPSKRYWALNNPLKDFNSTVGLTAEIVYNWNYDKLVQISTVSAECQLDHPYGINKYLAEQLVINNNPNNLVIRLGNLFGQGLTKGIIYDILNGNPLFVSSDSRYTFIDVDMAAKLIFSRFGKKGIENVCSHNTISLKEIVDEFGLDIKFGSRYECHPEFDCEDGPDITDIFKYIKLNLNK